jgi:hypothetical protein
MIYKADDYVLLEAATQSNEKIKVMKSPNKTYHYGFASGFYYYSLLQRGRAYR